MSTRAKRTAVEPGIFQDAHGFGIVAKVGSGKTQLRSPELRFPPDTDRAVLRAAFAREKSKLLEQRAQDPHADRRPGNLPADIRQYFRQATLSTQNAKARRQHLEWLIATFPNRRRDSLKHGELRAALNTIRTIAVKGKPSRPASASLKNDYRSAISHLFTVLDGKNAPNPVRDIPKYQEPPAQARDVSYDIIDAILAELRDTGAATGETRPPSRSKARLRVLAYAPITPAQLWRMPRANVDWTGTPPTILVPGRRKGAGTLPARKAIGPDALDAFRAFDAANLWQKIPSKASLGKAFIRARNRAIAILEHTRPDLDLSRARTMRLYDLRHSFATFAHQVTGNLDSVRALLDHADRRTTDRYAQGAVSQQLQDAGAAIAAAHAARRPTVH